MCVCEVWMVLCVWTWIRYGRDTEKKKAPCWHDPGNRVTSFFLSFVLSFSFFFLSFFLPSFLSLPLSFSFSSSPCCPPSPRRWWGWSLTPVGGAPTAALLELGCGGPRQRRGWGAGGARRRLLGGGQRSAGEQEPLHTLVLSFERKRVRREERRGKEPTSSCSVPRCPYL